MNEPHGKVRDLRGLLLKVDVLGGMLLLRLLVVVRPYR